MLRPLITSFVSLVFLTGLGYPAAMTGLSRLIFPHQAAGSLLRVEGQVRGSSLIGQATSDPRYVWCRPSSSSPYPTNAVASAGSTLAPSNPALAQAVSARARMLRDSDPSNPMPIPQDLITASGSGLDPHISPEGAAWQVSRVARTRGLDPARVQALVRQHTEGGAFFPLRVNVLELNLALDALSQR